MNNKTLSRFAATLLFFVIACILVLQDRSNLLDNDNYIEYFRGDGFSIILEEFFENVSFENFVITYFSEEIIWLAFTSLFSKVFSPNVSVYVLSLIVNFLVLLGSLKTGRPILAITLWLLIPVGFFTVGLYQLRQGLAFSIFFYSLYCLRSGKIGILVSGIHTTFILPYIFYLVDLCCRHSKRWIVPTSLVAFISFALASIGGYLFESFGGRRFESYSVTDGADSINYVISSSVFLVFYLSSYIHYYSQRNNASRIFSLMGFGISAFVITSFYTFPLGTSRVGYYLMLLALPLLAESGALNLSKIKEVRVFSGVLVLVFIAYQAAKTIIK